MSDLSRVGPPSALGRYRTCPGSSYASSKLRSVPKRAADLTFVRSTEKENGSKKTTEPSELLHDANENEPSDVKDVSRDEEDTTMENEVCVRSPVTLSRHRSCPVHSNGSKHVSGNIQLPLKRVTGFKKNASCTNSPVVLSRHRSCPARTNGRCQNSSSTIAASLDTAQSSKNVAGLLFFKSAEKRDELEGPEVGVMFNDSRYEENGIGLGGENLMSRKKEGNLPGEESVGDEECTIQATVTDDDIVYMNKNSDPTNDTTFQETLNTLKMHSLVSSLASNCSTNGSSTFTHGYSIFSNIICDIAEEGKMQKTIESFEEEKVEALSQSCSMALESSVNNTLSIESSGIHIARSNFSDDRSRDYGESLALNVQASNALTSISELKVDKSRSFVSKEESQATVKVANTKQYLAEKRKMTLESEESLRKFFGTRVDTDIESWGEGDSCDSNDLKHAFEVFTSYLAKKVNFR